MKIRCWDTNNEVHIKYHDFEWGVPLHNDKRFFEFLVLGGFQAGLSWWLVLQRRDDFRVAFDNFDPKIISRYSEADVERLMKASKIIHNKMKIKAAINNANKFLAVQTEFGTFDSFIWKFVGGRPIINTFETLKELPTETGASLSMSKELLKRGFQFVGPTICYAFMQATGLVNDHLTKCFRHKELQEFLDEQH